MWRIPAMTVDLKDELLQDFLDESEQTIEILSEKLVELEQSPDDKGLLNQVFRCFHNIKGGGGFLGLAELVRVCHSVEEVFDLLRNGQRTIDGALMDTALEATDVIAGMIKAIRRGVGPQAVDPALLDRLTGFASLRQQPDQPQPGLPMSGQSEHEQAQPMERVNSSSLSVTMSEAGAGEIPDDEFELLLDRLPGLRTGAGGQTLAKGNTASLNSAVGFASSTTSAGSVSGQKFSNNTVRVETRILDDIMNRVGELFLASSRISALSADQQNDDLTQAINHLDLVAGGLQTLVMKTRIQPINNNFRRYPRLVRDLARSLHKEVHLEMEGGDTVLDKTLLDALADPLVHLIRNAVDHGIENPDERIAAGKPQSGRVRLEAIQKGDQIQVTVADDGTGRNQDTG